MPGAAMQERPVELLQQLLRFDTTNPPGNERACIEWVKGLLEEIEGVDVRVVSREADRPNLIARLAGRGEAAPLLLQGHVDVVAARGQWRHAPFGGELHDGFVWGRGALDMKGGVAMMLAAFMRVAEGERKPPGDVILCLLADEEAGSDFGADFLVREHPQLFEGVRYSIGEFGGFTLPLGGRTFYPVMVAEKQICWLRATFRGQAGHGSMPVRGGAVGKLGAFLRRLDQRRLPVHVTDVVRSMVDAIAVDVPATLALPLRALLREPLTDRLLGVFGERGRLFDPLLHNTASATIVDAGEKINVIPGEVSVEVDGRLLPGFGPEDLFAELHAIAGVEMELEIVRHDAVTAPPNLDLLPMLSGALRELDPAARPIPLLLPGVTDGRFFSRLGIQTYGFLPMQLPPDMRFMELIHAQDERLPAAAVDFGTRAIELALGRFS